MTTTTTTTSPSMKVQIDELASSFSKCCSTSTSLIPNNTNNRYDGTGDNGSAITKPTTAVMIYQAGSILYEMSRRVQQQQQQEDELVVVKGYEELRTRFCVLVLTVVSEEEDQEDQSSALSGSTATNNVILGDITTAFLSISQSFRDRTTTHSTATDKPNNNEDSSTKEDVLAALRCLSGIYVHSKSARVCELGYTLPLCLELALLYHHTLNLQHHHDSTATDNQDKNSDDTITGCILPILSSLLIHGLLLVPHHNQTNGNNTSPISQQQDNEDDNTLHKIMEVFQTLSSASPTIHHTHVYGQEQVGCCLGDLHQWQQQTQLQMPTSSSSSHDASKDTSCSSATTLQQAIDSIFHRINNNNNNNNTNQPQPHDHNVQKDYLLQIIQSCPKSQSITPKTAPPSSNPTNTTTATQKNKKNQQQPTTAIHKLVQTVQSILPHLGEGYIEVALACYEHDAQRTISALMDAESNPKALHPRLKVLDTNLPARKTESKGRYETLGGGNKKTTKKNGNRKEEDNETEAYQIQKRHLKEMGDREEEDAYNLSIAMKVGGGGGGEGEYDDDYDDQYDGIGNDGGGGRGGIGGADGGGGAYDVDLDAVRAYNKVAKEAEADRIFWDESKNRNHRLGKVVEGGGKGSKKKDVPQEDGDGDGGGGSERTYRGPEKGKKGRIIGPDGKYLPIARGRKKNNESKGNGQPPPPPSTTNSNAKEGGNGGNKEANNNGGNKTTAQSDTGLTKIQKRRKNDNKAKLGNHHRKERAMKKAGM